MVLIIDDDVNIQEMLLDILDDEEIEAQAAGPMEALAALSTLRPSVVLLDVTMPGLDGYEILRQVRHDARLQGAFVLMLTGKGEVSDIQVGLETGADDYLRKPFHTAELVARVRRGLQKAE